MRTVMFVQAAAERGGAERVLLTLARALPAYGYRPVVAFLAAGPFVDEVRAAGIDHLELGVAPRAREIHRWPEVVGRVTSAARECDADVLVANGEKLTPWTGRAAHRAGVPAVFWLHDAPTRSLASTGLQLAMRLTPHAVAVAGSEWMAQQFRRRLAMRVRVIRHGIDPAPSAQDPRPLAGWPADALVVAHFGRLQRWKGADLFLRAAGLVAADAPSARFAVVGGALYGWERDYAEGLVPLASSLGIEDRVWFAGHRDDARALMGGCDVVVHSSVRDEPLGLVVPEAMAAGAAVVASRTRGPEEVVDDGRTGLLVRPGDVGALHDALRGLTLDPVHRRALADAGRAHVQKEWSAEAMAARHASLYDELTTGRSRVGA